MITTRTKFELFMNVEHTSDTVFNLLKDKLVFVYGFSWEFSGISLWERQRS